MTINMKAKAIPILLLAAAASSSCLKFDRSYVVDAEGVPVVFTTQGYFDAITKTSEVTSLSSIYVTASTGSAGSETAAWNSVTFTNNAGTYKGGKVWPVSNPNWHFRASNVPITFSGGDATVSATNSTDVVCAYLASPSFGTPNTLSFTHIFSRIGNVTVEAESGVTLTDVNLSITPKTSGTYNMRTASWTSTSNGPAVNLADASQTITTSHTKNNDLYLVPGTYTITASWTATKSGNTESFSNITDDITVYAGQRNSMTVTLDGAASINIGLSLTPWNNSGSAVIADSQGNPINYGAQPLTFTVETAGTILWKTTNTSQNSRVIYYSKNGGSTNSLTPTTSGASITVSAGDVITFTGSNSAYGQYYSNWGSSSTYYCSFGGTATFSVSGNIMSLVNSTDYQNSTSVAQYAFYSLFYQSNVTSAENLVLPATTVGNYAYAGLFKQCTSLTTAPELPATSVGNYGYSEMFRQCSSLEEAPELLSTSLGTNAYQYMFSNCTSLNKAPTVLPATTLTNYCYSFMFQSCTSLTSAPEIAATTLASNCCEYMFNYCSALTEAPALNATTMQNYCYYYMFYNCTSLATAPNLPATTVAQYCYANMFQGCTALTSVQTTLPATTLATSCYGYMFYGCSSLTTAPALPATSLVSMCYQYMFYNCSSLNYIKAYFTTTPSNSYTQNWVRGVASTGTFVKSKSATWTTTGTNGVPSGWTVTKE